MWLKDRIAIVTGARSGIGRGIEVEFARDGAWVVTTDIHEHPRRGKTAIQDDLTPDQIEDLRQRTPLSRRSEPRDLGPAAVCLASPDAAWITGVTLVVDGGLMCRI